MSGLLKGEFRKSAVWALPSEVLILLLLEVKFPESKSVGERNDLQNVKETLVIMGRNIFVASSIIFCLMVC